MNTTSTRAGIPPDADREQYSTGPLHAYSWIEAAIAPLRFLVCCGWGRSPFGELGNFPRDRKLMKFY
ncbi:hypothetical protein [Baaleninema simplex]|uniref:hypothetical protein n=1 Tax=Baaleninema simplex TaxID=2862350 RepID=UPI0003477328|nr:hypothetical protein [Baaleninema simplex]